MFGTHFYNEGLRRLTIAFGQIFNDIIVQTKDANDSVVKDLKCLWHMHQKKSL